ncbi:MAG: NTP transferase domain-containing protein [Elusimicrobiota bacterium]
MMQVVIPMCGSGERFRAAGYRMPKPLIPVDGKPVIAHLIEKFPKGWPLVFICTTGQVRRLRPVLRRLRPKARIAAIPAHSLGPVHSVLQAGAAVVDELPTLVNYCDFSFVWDPAHFTDFARKTRCDGAIVCYRGFHPHSLGGDLYAYCREERGRVLEVREKGCFTDDKTKEFASSGTYYFRTGRLAKQAFREAVRQGLRVHGEYYASMPYNILIRKGMDVRVYEIPTFLQWGTPEDLEDYLYWHKAFKAWTDERRAPAKGPRLVMPMAGLGRRFTGDGLPPKPLIPVLGRPMYRAAMGLLPPTGPKPILITRKGIGVNGAVELPKATEGQAATVLAAEPFLRPDEPVLVSACDHGLLFDPEAWGKLLRSKPDVVVVGQRGYPGARRKPKDYSYIEEKAGRVQRVSVKEPGPPLVLVGTFYFREARLLFRSIRRLKALDLRVNGELYLDSAVDICIRDGLDVRSFESDAYLCWGSPDELAEFRYWHRYFRGGPA